MTSHDRILPSLEVVAGESQLKGQTRAPGPDARTNYVPETGTDGCETDGLRGGLSQTALNAQGAREDDATAPDPAL